MAGWSSDPQADPRPSPRDDAPALDSSGALRPAVAGAPAGSSLWLIGGAVVLGLLVFLWLSAHRPHPPASLGATAPTGVSSAAFAPAPPAPADVLAAETAARGLSQPPAPAPLPAPRPAPALPTPAPPRAAAPDGKTPVLVVDLSEPEPVASAATPLKQASSTAPASNLPAGARGLNGDEQFAERVSGAEPDRASATVMRGRSTIVAQGAIIPAVLETALDSDLPGFARAVVSRDVRSFDGQSVLIPRGSRLIGEYRSAATQGQTRAFVIWTRVLRPDGVSVQIGSPATDPLGRAGLSGSVDTHFFARFGGAILLSVVNAGVASIAGTPSTEVVIGSSQGASGIGSALSAFAPANISPTIKVPQGTPIRVFVARDLDFSPVRGREP